MQTQIVVFQPDEIAPKLALGYTVNKLMRFEGISKSIICVMDAPNPDNIPTTKDWNAVTGVVQSEAITDAQKINNLVNFLSDGEPNYLHKKDIYELMYLYASHCLENNPPLVPEMFYSDYFNKK